MKIRLILLLLVFFKMSNSQSKFDKYFDDANNFYKEGNYIKAIENYTLIKDNGLESFELYYNLGNCYYKQGDIPFSILYYEKARKINSDNEELNKNIKIVKQSLVDKIEEIPDSFISKIINYILNIFTYNHWGIGAICFSILSFLTFFVFKKSDYSNKQKLFFYLFVISLILSILFLSISINRFKNIENNKEAIIFSTNIYIKSEPNINSKDLFILHEGTKVKVLKRTDDWVNIKISDGKTGWIEYKYIKLI